MKKLLAGIFSLGMVAALGIGAAPQALASGVDTSAPSVDAEPETTLCIPIQCKAQGGYCCHPTVCCVP